jgi:hypothetical protein
MADGDSLVLGTQNTFGSQTFLERLASGTTTAFAVLNLDGGGIAGSSATGGTGVEGASDTGTGVRGAANSGIGVSGRCTSGPAVEGLSAAADGVVGITQGDAMGIRGIGYATATGVCGTSEAGTGVAGQSSTGVGVSGISSTDCGVYGESDVLPAVAGRCAAHTSQTAGVMGIGDHEGCGVAGTSLAGNGVQAFSRDTDALVATSVNGRGVVGIAQGTSSASVGVLGEASVGRGPSAAIGIFGSSRHGTAIFGSTVDGIAGHFFGQVIILGDLAVTGTKSAAVRHPDGSRRLTYAVESPEAWLEDFGRGQLAAGHATVALDRDFAAVIDDGGYHVFLTPQGDSNGLYVAAQTPEGFEVREQRDGTSDLTFSYRVVGRRKDVDAARLAPIDLPAMPDLPDVTIPQPAEPPLRPRAVPAPPDRPTPS